MEAAVQPSPVGRGRKKVAQKNRAQRAKEARHSGRDKMPAMPTCNHDTKSYRCKKLSRQDIENFHSAFYATSVKTSQDAFLLKHMNITKPKRSRVKKIGSSRKSIAVRYIIRNYLRQSVNVCQKTFLGILGISKDRVQRVSRFFHFSGKLPEENRGGDRRSNKYKEKRQSVRKFIETLKGVESHYCRSNTNGRMYLASDLSIAKLFRMYNEKYPELNVKRTFFRKIFCREYNIGFGTPITDACSKCISLKEQIKRENNEAKKTTLISELRVHKLRGAAFFEILKEKADDLVTLSFDCQKNLVNPKIPDQAAYYSRQLYTFNFTVVRGSSRSPMTPENIYIYTWMEHEYNKGANEIASALYHCLNNTDLTNCKILRLCADGCGGQNRNTIVIGMICFWVAKIAPSNIKEVQLIFPVSGHSFIPPDRVFGRIEKQLRSKSTITNPEIYNEIFREHGTLRLLTSCEVKDWKSATASVFKPPGSWHFKFNEMKRFILKKNRSGEGVLVRGEPFYKSNIGKGMSTLKRGKKIDDFHPIRIEQGVPVNSAKLADVKKLLLKHFGEDWHQDPALAFYKALLDNDVSREDGESCEENFCDGNDNVESAELRV